MATVTFENVTKSYDGTVAVRDLNLEVADSEFLVLVGPSGRGKTTALRMIAGLEQITEGRLLIGDRVVNNVAPVARDIAMVEQTELQGRILELEEELAKARGTPVRHKMPDTRMSLTHRFEIAGHEGYITVEEFVKNRERLQKNRTNGEETLLSGPARELARSIC